MEDLETTTSPKLVIIHFDPIAVGQNTTTKVVTIVSGKRTVLPQRRHDHQAEPVASDASGGLTLRAVGKGETVTTPVSLSTETTDETPPQKPKKEEPEEERKRKRRFLAGYICFCATAILILGLLLGLLLKDGGTTTNVTPTTNGGLGGNKVQSPAVWFRAEIPLLGGSGLSTILAPAAFAESPEPFGVLLRQAVADAVGIIPSSVLLHSLSVNATSLPELLGFLNTTTLPSTLQQLFTNVNMTSALSALPVSAYSSTKNWTFETGTWTFESSHPVNAMAFDPVSIPARRRRMVRRRLGSGSNATTFGNETVAECTNVTVQLQENNQEAIPVTYVRFQLLLPSELISIAGNLALDEAAAAYLRLILSMWGQGNTSSSSSLRTTLSSWENCTAVPASVNEELAREVAPDTIQIIAEVIQEKDTTTNTVSVVSVVPSPSNTPSSSPTPTPTQTPTPTSSTTNTAAAGTAPLTSPTATLSAATTETATVTSSATSSSSSSSSASATSTVSGSSTSSSSVTSTSSATSTSTSSPSSTFVPATAVATYSSSASSSASSSLSATASVSPSGSSTVSSSGTSTATSTVSSSSFPTTSRTPASSTSATATATPTSTNTQGGAGAASCPNVAPTTTDAFLGSGESSWTAVAFDAAADDAYYLSSNAILVKREKATGKRWVLADLGGTCNDMIIDTRSDTLYVIKDNAIHKYTTAGVATGSSFTISGCTSPGKFAWDASYNLIVGCSVWNGGGFYGIVVRVNPSSPGTVTTLVSQSAWVAFETAANGNSGGFSSLAVDTTNNVMYIANFWGSVNMQRFSTSGGSNAALKMMGSNLNGQNAGWYGMGIDLVTGKVYASWSAPSPATVGGITYYSGVYSWASYTTTGSVSQVNAITRTGDSRLCCGSLNVHYYNSVGYVYGADMRMPLPTSGEPNAPMQYFLQGWYTPAGYVATDTLHYIASQRYTGIIITSPDATKLGGGISWALTTSLTSPRQICGISGTSLYVIDSGTSIKAVDVGTGTITSFVTGLTDVWTCSMDAGGSGDILLVDGYVIKRVPAGSSTPIASSSLTTVFTLNVQHTGILLPILSIAGDVAKSLYLVSTPGDYDINNYVTNSNAGMLRINNNVETVIGVGTQTDSGGPITNADGSRFGNGLYLTSSGELYITSPDYAISLAYVKATDVTTVSDFSTKWAAIGNGAAYGPFVSVSSSGKIYTASGGIVNKAC